MSYLTEELVKKWQPVLEHADLPDIKDPHKRQVVATLLENQEHAAKKLSANVRLLKSLIAPKTQSPL